MNVSIVIPAYNEAATLSACLAALVDQRTHHLRVIVVNNGSTDNTVRMARSWQDHLDLRVINEPVKGRGSARRRGFAEADTDVILSTDADSRVPPEWVESLVGIFVKDPTTVAATGSSYITDGTRLTNWTMKIGMPLSLRLYRLLMGHYMLTGANFAIRRQAYEAAGGFDVSRDMLDDVDLSFRVAPLGRIVYVARLRVETEGDIFRYGYVRGFWHYFRHFPSLVKRYGWRRRRL